MMSASSAAVGASFVPVFKLQLLLAFASEGRLNQSNADWILNAPTNDIGIRLRVLETLSALGLFKNDTYRTAVMESTHPQSLVAFKAKLAHAKLLNAENFALGIGYIGDLNTLANRLFYFKETKIELDDKMREFLSLFPPAASDADWQILGFKGFLACLNEKNLLTPENKTALVEALRTDGVSGVREKARALEAEQAAQLRAQAPSRVLEPTPVEEQAASVSPANFYFNCMCSFAAAGAALLVVALMLQPFVSTPLAIGVGAVGAASLLVSLGMFIAKQVGQDNTSHAALAPQNV